LLTFWFQTGVHRAELAVTILANVRVKSNDDVPEDRLILGGEKAVFSHSGNNQAQIKHRQARAHSAKYVPISLNLP
jgi:hypothetical protein